MISTAMTETYPLINSAEICKIQLIKTVPGMAGSVTKKINMNLF